MVYVFNGIFMLVEGLLQWVWWTVFLPLALLVFGLRLLGGDPEAQKKIADGGSLVYFVAVPIGLAVWCAVMGLLWWNGVLESALRAP